MKSKLLLGTIVLFFGMMVQSRVVSAQGDTLEVQRDRTSGKVSFARFMKTPRSERSLSNAKAFLHAVLVTRADDELKLVAEEKDEYGNTHQKFQHYYKGVKVESSEYLAHAKGGYIESVNGDFRAVTVTNTKPSIEAKAALAKAVQAVNATNYAWKNENDPYYPKGDLVITKGKDGTSYLTWQFSIAATQPLIDERVYVDARTGAIVKRYSQLCTTNATGTAETHYSGTQTITADLNGGTYRLRETRNSPAVSITTLNFGNGAIPNSGTPTGTDFVDNNNTWTAAEWANGAKDQMALDVHWASERVLDYWKIVRLRNSLDNQASPLPIKNFVHATFGGTNPNDNAAWSSTFNAMFYGDGDDFIFHQVTALDVIAHEMGHGLNQFTSHLGPNNDEPGALNEGLSDIWGATIEAWAAPGKSRWRIGEEVMANGHLSLRSLQNPKTDGDEPCPDTFQGNNWLPFSDNRASHNNSTVISHWFYLLSEGGTGTKENGDCFFVPAIGITNAASIVLQAQRFYITSGTNFTTIRTAMISAANDLAAAIPGGANAVTNAFHAVGIGAAASPSLSIAKSSGNYELCGTESWTFTANAAVVPGFGVDWTILYSTGAPSYGVQINGTLYPTSGGTPVHTGNTITVTAPSGYGSFWVQARLNDNCHSANYVSSVQSGVGVLNSNQFSIGGPSSLCRNTTGYFNASTPYAQGITGYQWTASSNFVSSSGGSSSSFAATTGGTFYGGAILLRLQNRCGLTNTPYVKNIGSSGCFAFMATPNPARTGFQINTVDKANTFSGDAVTEIDVPITSRLLNAAGTVVWTSGKDNTRSVDTSGFPEGVYILQIYHGEEYSTQKVLVQH